MPGILREDEPEPEKRKKYVTYEQTPKTCLGNVRPLRRIHIQIKSHLGPHSSLQELYRMKKIRKPICLGYVRP